MPECDFTIDESRRLQRGKSTVYRVKPDIVHPCVSIIKIDGERAQDHLQDVIGDFAISAAADAAGMVAVTPQVDRSRGVLQITVECRGDPPCGPTTHTYAISSVRLPVEILKTLGLVVTLPISLLGFLLWLLFAGLQVGNPRPWRLPLLNWLKDVLDLTTDLFPDWLKDIWDWLRGR